MAELDEVYDALRKADAAGDVASAKKLADYIRSFQAPQMSTGEKALGAVRPGIKGLTLGWGDEAGAGIAALAAKATGEKRPLSEIYSEMHGDISEQQKQFEKQYQKTSMGAEIAGGLVPAVLSMGASAPESAASIGNVMLRGAAAGAGQGAIYGAGTADEGQRIEGAKKGAEVGAVAGAVLPAAATIAGRGLAKIYQGARNMVITPETRAEDVITMAARRSGLDPEIIADKMQKLGPEATLADADENLLQQAVAAVNQFGPTKEAARDLMRTRQLGEHADTLSVLSEQLGGFSGDDLANALRQNALDRQSKASPLYRAAFSQDLPQSKDLEILLNNDTVQDAMKKAEFFAANDLSRIDTIDGRPYAKMLTDTERLHYAKQALFDMESAAKRAGRNEEAKIYGGLRTQVTSQLDNLPEYKLARQIWSSSMEAQNAGEVGQNIFKMSPGEFKEAVKGMNDHELEMAKMGVMNSATEKAGATQDSRSIAGMLTNTENGRQKIKVLFGSEDQYKSLIDNAKKWDTFKHSANAITGGSPTAERLTAQKEMSGIGMITEPIDTMKEQLADIIFGSEMSPEVAKHVGGILTKKGLTRNQIIDLIGRENSKYVPLAQKAAVASPIPLTQSAMSRE